MSEDDCRLLRLWLPILSLVCLDPLLAMAGSCDFSVRNRNAVYNYSLASPVSGYPHGVLSEDGFYKIAANETLLWFQLCDQMIFNHALPSCFGCQDCGGPSRCGTGCSALLAENVEGYYVCKTIGYASNLDISLIDDKFPEIGVIVKMFAFVHGENCSLSVSVFCDSHEAQVTNSLQYLGSCSYATELRHPSGCAEVISKHGGGLGWFGTLIVIVLCLLGGYLLVGTIYRFFFLGIHSAEAIPNLDFWLSIPQRTKTMVDSLVRRSRRPRQHGQSSYAPLDS